MNNTLHTLEILEKTVQKIEGAYAPSTIRAYKSSFERFIQFCEEDFSYQKSSSLACGVKIII
jgi:hypothetical protein